MLRLFFGGALVLLFISISSPDAHAQDKSRYEKMQEKKNKSNRRLKRRGDKGRSNKGKLRSTKFKIRSRQGERAYQGDITGRRFQSKGSPHPHWGARIAQPNPYAGRKRTSEASRAKALKQTPRYSARQRERAWKGNAAGRAIIGRSQRTTFVGKKAYQQGAGSGRSITRNPERPRKIKRIVPRSASGAYQVRKRKNPYVFRQRSPWEKAFQGNITGRKFKTKRTEGRPGIKQPPQPKYTSRGGRRGDRAYNGKIQGGYKSISRDKERAWKNDISGNKLRIRTSGKAKFSGTQFQTYPKGKRRGDQAYKGKMKGGGYKSISSRKERAGERTPSSRPPGEGTLKAWKFQGNIKSGKPLKGGGSISGKRWNNNGRAIQGRGPRDQDARTARFQGNIKSGRPLKGGGSISGKHWNNDGRAVQGRGPRDQDARTARFQGNLKSGRPLKGGGSISGKHWNNNGRAVQGRSPRDQDVRTARFQGNLKGYKPLKGGGSISRNHWNNQGKPVIGKGPRDQDSRIAKFQGNIKGGGSERAKENSRKAAGYRGKIPAYMLQRGPDDDLRYTGNIKKKRNYIKNPNSAREALKVKELSKNYRQGANYRGKIPAYMLEKGPDDEHKYTGNIKALHYKKNEKAAREALKTRAPDQIYFKKKNYQRYQGDLKRGWKYKQSPYAAEEALKSREPGKNERLSANFQGLHKQRANYKQNKTAADESLKKKYPGKNYFKGGEYQGSIKQTWKYKQNPLSADESLKNRPPGAGSKKGFEYQGNIKRTWRYKQNPHSADEALKNRPPSQAMARGMKYQGNLKMANYKKRPNAAEGALKGIGPSRASIQASNYQGNIKMKKQRIEDRHPDFKYLSSKSNGKAEKEKMFSFKLLWSRWFKKNENQPNNLKEKERRPRYDKREDGLWND